MELSNHTILITGGTSGIGLQMAIEFSNLGNNVIVVGRDEERLSLLKNKYPVITWIKLDIANTENRIEFARLMETNFKNINVLINNAAIQNNIKFLSSENDITKIESEIQINLIAPLHLSLLLYPLMVQNPSPIIINISSGLALAPKSTATVYCATKAALHSFSIGFRNQNPSIKIVEVISPLVDTKMTSGRGKGKISPEKYVKQMLFHLKNDETEIYIGKAKLLKILLRLLPSLAYKMMKRT